KHHCDERFILQYEDIAFFLWVARHLICCGNADAALAVFVVYRHDETGLASEIETMEVVSLGFEDHGFCSPPAFQTPHARQNSLVRRSAFRCAFKYEHRHRTPQRGHEGGMFYNLLAVRLPAASRRSERIQKIVGTPGAG